MSLRFDILSVRASVTGYYAIACLYFPSGLSSSGSATITPDSGVAQAIADSSTAIYLLLAESGSTTLHSKGAAISALPDTSSLPFTVEVREVASNPTNTQAGLASAFSSGSTIAQRQPCEGSMQGGWVKSGVWLLAPYLDALVSDAGGSGGSAGTGDIVVNHDTGGADNLRYTESDGITGIDEATVRAYLKSDYNAGTYAVRGEVKTGTDGRWVENMMLNAGVYRFVFSRDGYATASIEETVS